MELFDITAKDFGPYATLRLPLADQGLVWIGGSNLDSQGARSNGAGKSHIFKAVCWALYGKSTDREAGDKVIRDGATTAVVDLRLRDSESKLWTLRRTRGRGTPRLELFGPSGDKVVGSRDEIQTRVVDMLGLDYRAFCNTVLYAQNDALRFAASTTTDAERKETLHRILRLELLSDCQEIAADCLSGLKSQAEGHRDEASRYQSRIDEHDLKAMEGRVAAWEDERAEKIEAAKAWAKKHRDMAVECLRIADSEPEQEDLSPYRDQLRVVEARIGSAQERVSGLEAKREVVKQARRALNSASRHTDALRNHYVVAVEAVTELSGEKCPLCTSLMDRGAAAKHLNSRLADRDRMARELAESECEVERLAREAEDAEARVEKLWEANGEISDLQSHRRGVEKQLAAGEKRNLMASVRRDKARGEAATAANRAREALKQAKAYARESNPYTAQLEEVRQKVQGYQQERDALISEAKALEEQFPFWQFWVTGFGNQGMPSYLLDSVMPYLTKRANRYLRVLADGDITLAFSSQSELKSAKGEYRDRIDVSWRVEGLDGYPPSGGQLKKMEIATDLALMDLVSSRESARLGLLMFDEVLDGLDGEGRERVLRLLHTLRSERHSIFVISHQPDMSEVFTKAWRVVKRGEISAVEGAD